MNKTIIVSNRLPLNIKKENNTITVEPSVGGLATGLKSVHQSGNSYWVGWTGLKAEEITDDIHPKVEEALKKERCLAVDLTGNEVEDFYFGFSNRTVWPLFHYFTEYTEFEERFWQEYVNVNQKFADAVLQQLEPGDRVWVHDYQLMLVPKMIKDKVPDAVVGFFLHIPFPSFEVFRILPWREDILHGLLGSDLVGFHTFNYQRHFLSSVRRLLGYEINFNEINMGNTIVKADSFPMGIDYDRFHNQALGQQQKSVRDRSQIHQEIDKHLLMKPDVKLVLSIDRLDYSKGIANRLYAYEHFLENYPEFLEKVILIMLAVPSRSNVSQYQLMKSEVDEQVGRINGKFSTINWSPVWYFYRSMPFENLIDLYTSCDVAMITPVRDGMNLVAKEYIASKVNKKGVLILSEMAGAAHEMGESIIVNPNNYAQVAKALNDALTMSAEEQADRLGVMQARLKSYNIEKWSNDFLNSLDKIYEVQTKFKSKILNDNLITKLVSRYKTAKKRMIFLDYDGTLVEFKSKPHLAKPDKELYDLLDKLASDPQNNLTLISGRDRATFEKWFDGHDYTLVVEHGVWSREIGGEWELIEQMENDWKDNIRPALQFYVDRTPGSILEEKNYSLVWHYRKADPELGSLRAKELKDELTSFVANHSLEIMEGNKVIEVKNAGINKGKAALKRIKDKTDFVLGIGDDWTDEYLFEHLPDDAVTVKVGIKNTHAKYNIKNVTQVRELLAALANS